MNNPATLARTGEGTIARRRLLTDEQWASLLALPSDERNLVRHCTLAPDDIAALATKRADYNRLGYALILCAMRLAEILFGIAAHSVALLADAAHNLGDVLGLLLAWGALWFGRHRPTRTRTYGFGRSPILASLTNAVVLLVGVGAIAVETVQRLVSGVPAGASSWPDEWTYPETVTDKAGDAA